jgi:uncharacterized coiled-coil protein SlyX
MREEAVKVDMKEYIDRQIDHAAHMIELKTENRIEAKIDRLDAKMTRMDEKFDARFTKMDERFDTRMRALEDRHSGFQQQIIDIHREIAGVYKHISLQSRLILGAITLATGTIISYLQFFLK